MAKKTVRKKQGRAASGSKKSKKTSSRVAAGPAAKRGKAAPSRPPTVEKPDQAALRKHLLYLLRGGGAHVSFEKAIAGLPMEARGARPQGLDLTAWRLLEHLRIAQWDILEFSRDAKHVSPSWPSGYWPQTDSPPDAAAWEKSLQAFRADLERMQKLISNPKSDLLARIPHGDGQTLLREALLIVDHNAYHVGQLVLLRRLLGVWGEAGFTL